MTIPGASVAIVQIHDFLLVTIQEDLHDQLALELQQALSERIARYNPSGVLIDISALSIVDTFIARVLADMVAAARLMGTHAVLVGMQPAVALTLVELGVTLVGVRSALSIDRGMEVLRTLAGQDR